MARRVDAELRRWESDVPVFGGPSPESPRDSSAPRPRVVRVVGPTLELEDYRALGEELAAVFGQPEVVEVICDVSEVTAPDATAVNALLRMQLAALRSGKRLTLRGSRPHLRMLLWLYGLEEVLRSDDDAVTPPGS